MALKHTLESLDGLPEEIAKLYVKKDGKFVLDVDDDPAKATMTKLRQELADKEKALRDLEQAEAAAKAEKEKAELERKGEYEKLSAQMQAEKDKLAKELADERAAREESLKESAAVAALGAAGLKVNRFLLAEVKNGLEVVQGKVLVKGDPSSTPEKLLAKLKEDPECAGLFPASGSGGGTPPAGGQGSNSTKARFDELNAKAAKGTPLTQAEGIEVIKLGQQLSNTTNPSK